MIIIHVYYSSIKNEIEKIVWSLLRGVPRKPYEHTHIFFIFYFIKEDR